MNNLFQLIDHAKNLYGESVFLDCPSESGRQEITYNEFARQVDKQARFLMQFNIQKGDRVAFLTPKTHHQAYLFYAIWRINGIAVPVSESMGDSEVSFIINDADPKLVILHESLMSRKDSIAEGRQVISFDDLYDDNNSELPENILTVDDTATLIYTSGSTGKPKGVMLSHRNLIVNARSSGDRLNVEQGERMLSLLPYWHSFALIAELIMMAMARGTVIFAKDRRDFAKNMASFNCSMMLVVPRMAAQFKLMLEKECEKLGHAETLNACLANANELFKTDDILSQDPSVRAVRMQMEHSFLSVLKKAFGSRFKHFIGGGAPIAQELQEFFRDIDLPVFQGYGLTETSPVISANTAENSRSGSSGKLLSWLEPENGGDYTFLDSEGNRAKDIEGELLVKGDCVMQGYWGHKDESAKSIQDGWLHTGDIGKVVDGYMYITGRASNLLVLKGGEKVHPEHVENLIKKCPLVKEVMLIGEKCKNVYAVVNVEENELEDVNAELKKQLSEATADLAPFQKPGKFLILPDFNPEDGTMTPTLKIRRKNVWQTYFKELSTFLEANNEEVHAPAGSK
ncbi:MAG: AMP-binding protein [Lentisphaeraceae bacterium]|nr:AMP-binding protein [Lentisphaeraceae bacterium]